MNRLTKHLMDLREEIRRAQRRKRTLCAAEEKKKKCRDFHIKVATEICRFCKGSTTEALRFLEMKGCSREDGHPWSHPAVLDLATASVVEPCADASVQPADDAITSVMKVAQSFLLEHRTFDWVRFKMKTKDSHPCCRRQWNSTNVCRRKFAHMPKCEPCQSLHLESGSGHVDGPRLGRCEGAS